MPDQFPIPPLSVDELHNAVVRETKRKDVSFVRHVGDPVYIANDRRGHRVFSQMFYAEFSSENDNTVGTIIYVKEN